MTHLIRSSVAIIASLAMFDVAEAHVGNQAGEAAGLAAGFVHPFVGLDHLLAMLAVGLWASSLGGAARWLVPATFLALMTIGAWAGAQGVTLPAVEAMIAASVVVLGVLIAWSIRVAVPAAAALVALFGVVHGHAHGSEMPPMALPPAYAAGFVAATAILQMLGLGFGRMLPRLVTPPVLPIAGGAIAAAGVALALPI